MKITVAPISTFAHSSALTQREWESLGRFAVLVESEIGHRMDNSYIGNSPVLPRPIYDLITHEIQTALAYVDMEPADWFMYLSPVLPKAVPLPPNIEEWTLHLRLLKNTSTAKARVIAKNIQGLSQEIPFSRPWPPEDHKPTLSEQFEKKD